MVIADRECRGSSQPRRGGRNRRKTLRAPAGVAAPRYIDHPELHGADAYRRLFEAVEQDESVVARQTRRFKQMHYAALQMHRLVAEQGAGAVEGPEYRQWRERYDRIRDELANENLGLVYTLFKRSRIANVDTDELLSEGMVALTRSIDSFDPWKGYRFSTYACNAILRAFFRCGQRAARRREHEPLNFDAALQQSDWIEIQRADESALFSERLARILDEGRAALTPIEESVLFSRFPRGGRPRQSLGEIGGALDLSKERVRQIQNRALRKLREALQSDPVLQ